MSALRTVRVLALLAAVPVAPWVVPATTREAPDRRAASAVRRDTCMVCHPAAVKALAFTPHQGLVAGATARADACTSCHGEQAAHVASALDPTRTLVRPTAVTATACAACHDDARPLRDAAHPWFAQLDRTPRPTLPAGVPGQQAKAEPLTVEPLQVDPLPPRGTLGYDLGLLARAGYRFVNVFGSRDRYDSDLNLDGGVRLTDLDVHARGGEASTFDRVDVSLRDLADPSMRLRGEIARDDAFTGKARFHRDAFLYRAAGDFHRVDRRSEEWGFDLDLEVDEQSSVFASFTRRLQDGFWLARRIGNRNVAPITTVTGVSSPRQHDADHLELGVRGTLLGMHATAAVEYRAHGDVDRWVYSRPAPGNPLALESEDFASASTLRGPGARLTLSDTFGPVAIDAKARVIELDRRIRGNGVGTGFDIAEFQSSSVSLAEGGAETWLVDVTATWELSDDLAVLGDVRWRDHAEELRVAQTDVVTYPTLNSSTTTSLQLDQRTAQRTFEGSVGLQARPHATLTLFGGYGFSREWLRVPDLEANDGDYRRGRLQDDGVLADARWKPTDRWTASVGFREFGQSGMQLHELSDDDVRGLDGRLRYQRETWWLEAFTDNRRKANDVSGTRLEAWTSGLTAGLDLDEDTNLWTSYAYGDLESRTLTNFYFDPVPTPVPTLVGFDGTTHTVSAGAKWALARRTHLELSGAYTSTRGTFDVQVFDVRADLSVKACSSSDVGVMLRRVDYQEDAAQSAGLDDYGAYLTFLYFRTRIGAPK